MATNQIQEGEVVVEVQHTKDTLVSFFPAGMQLRSRWFPKMIGLRAPDAYTDLPIEGIPGQRVHLDEKNRVARITDPLADDENKSRWEHIKRCDANLRARGKASVLTEYTQPCAEKRFERLTDADIITWKFWMRQLVDGKRDFSANYKDPTNPIEVKSHGEMLQGTLPTQVEMLKTGKVRAPSYRQGNPLDRNDRFIDVDPELIAMAETDGAN